MINDFPVATNIRKQLKKHSQDKRKEWGEWGEWRVGETRPSTRRGVESYFEIAIETER